MRNAQLRSRWRPSPVGRVRDRLSALKTASGDRLLPDSSTPRARHQKRHVHVVRSGPTISRRSQSSCVGGAQMLARGPKQPRSLSTSAVAATTQTPPERRRTAPRQHVRVNPPRCQRSRLGGQRGASGGQKNTIWCDCRMHNYRAALPGATVGRSADV